MNSNRLNRVQKSLDAIERGMYSEFSLSQCCDYIAWMVKWNKVDKEVWEPLCAQATRLLEAGF